MYPKWEAYQRLVARVPEPHLSVHILCRNADEVRQAWSQVASATNRVGVRTDMAGGAAGLPFIHKATLDEALNLVAEHEGHLVFLLAQYVEGDIHGKAIRLDEDAVLVEWGNCATAREFDAGKCATEHVVLGPWTHAVWGEQVWRCEAVTRQPAHLRTLYRVFQMSGLSESTWSLTHDGRVVLWG